MRQYKHEDLTGKRFGKLLVIGESERNKYGHIQWLCICDCGKTVVSSTSTLKSGGRKSCGCLSPRLYSNNKRLYNVWRGMLNRCENEKCGQYKLYGGRGISVCSEWHDFGIFLKWAESNGYDKNAPYGKCTIDRIDSNLDYCPENCRWVDIKSQSRNNRHNHLVTIDGVAMPLVSAAEMHGISINTVKKRIQSGWNDVDAVTIPSARSKSARQK